MEAIEDVKATAAKVVEEIDRTATWGSDDHGIHHEVAAMIVEAAILAERERCAKIADPPLMHRKGPPGLWRRRRAEIASSIRSGAR